MKLITLVIFCFIAFICLVDSQSQDPSISPTAKPTSRAPTIAPSGPSRKPTRKPTRSPTFRAKANSIYADFAPTETLTSEQQQGIVGTLTVLLFVLMATEITGPEVLFLIALIIVILTEILSLSQGLAGFSNNAVITIGTLFLVVGAVEKSHVVDWMARKTFGVTGSTFIGKLRMYVTCFFLSIFFNNTPLVAILMPVVKDWGRMRGIGASQLLMPLSYSVLAGSYGSMIGTSTNLTIQGLMQADRGYSFSFFAPLPIGLVCFVALLAYMLLFGPLMLPMNRSGLIREARDSAKQLIAEVLVSEHSPAVGRNLAFFAASLGVAPSSVIKIRRVAGSEPSKDIEGGSNKNRFSAILDRKYLKKAARFWESDKKKATEEEVEVNETPDSLEYIDIIAPPPHELVGANDVIFLSSAQDAVEKMMKSILGESKGLKILKSDVLALPGFGTEVVECVVSDNNPFLGKKVSEMAKEFSERYQAALITVRGREWGDFLGEGEEEEKGEDKKDREGSSDEVDDTAPRTATGHRVLETEEDTEEGKNNNNQVIVESEIELTTLGGEQSNKVSTIGSSEDVGLISEKKVLEVPTVSEHILTLGDVILCVTNEKNVNALSRNRDFFVVSSVGSLPKPLSFYTLIPVICFIAMLILVACETIDICPAALALTAFFFMGGWIVPEDIPVMVDIRLLMLLGASLSFATSMTTSGLAATIAKSISEANPSPFSAILLIYAITLVITELISNNAAAALMYPIAVGLADQLNVSFKPFAMAVLVASTAGFMSPIGYQTHVMVWGPGGYRFKDFMLFGIAPDIIYWLLGCALTVALFPLHE